MKRCPECLFIYPDADTHCDFDNTLLVVVDEAELDAATAKPKTPTKQKRSSTKNKPASTKPKQATKKRQRKITTLTAVVGLFIGLSTFFVYYRSAHHHNTNTPNTAQTQATPIASAQQIVASIPSPSPLAIASPAPTAIPTQISTNKPATDRIATAHTTTTANPISTSGPGMIKNGKTVIVLTTGSKIAADEVWRTRDGVWYRRDGIVTLLKRGQVKAIINQ
jgi:hypothetical protein